VKNVYYDLLLTVSIYKMPYNFQDLSGDWKY